MKKNGVLWGIVIILAGIVIGLKSFGLFEVNIFFDGWWTLFIIVPATIGLFTEKRKTGNIICLLVGVLLLLAVRDVIKFELLGKLVLPVIIVFIGAKLIINSISSKNGEAVFDSVKQNGEIPTATGAFSSSNINFDGEVFRGCELTATFGGVKCDLSGAIIEEDAAIKLTAVFGGVDIILPKNVKVKVVSNSLFGGVSDKTESAKDASAPTVYINALCMFGGAELK